MADADQAVEVGDVPVFAIWRLGLCVRLDLQLGGVSTFAVSVEERQAFVAVAELPDAVFKRLDGISVDPARRCWPSVELR